MGRCQMIEDIQVVKNLAFYFWGTPERLLEGNHQIFMCEICSKYEKKQDKRSETQEEGSGNDFDDPLRKL